MRIEAREGIAGFRKDGNECSLARRRALAESKISANINPPVSLCNASTLRPEFCHDPEAGLRCEASYDNIGGCLTDSQKGCIRCLYDKVPSTIGLEGSIAALTFASRLRIGRETQRRYLNTCSEAYEGLPS